MKKQSYTPEEIQKRFEALPADIKSLVYGPEMLNLIQQVGTKYHLHIDQLDTLEVETADVMTGFSEAEEFVGNLTQSLLVDGSIAQQIAKDINDELFVKVRESMKKSYEAQKEGTPVTISRPTAVVAPPMPRTLAPEAAAPAPSPTPLATPTPAKPVEMHPADLVLTQKSVTSTPPAAPAVPAEAPKPKPYTADPYREPIQ